MLCPICLKKNIKSHILKLSESGFICKEELCSYFLDLEATECSINISGEKFKNKSNRNYDRSSILSLRNNSDQNTTFDLINNDNSINVLAETHKTIKSNIMNKNLHGRSIINWLKLSTLKVQSKIICFLILHLDVFRLNIDSLLNELKNEYSIINKFANLFKMELVNSLCFNFISKLSLLSKSVSKNEDFDENFENQILKSLNNYLINFNSKERVLCKYTFHFDCRSCNVVYSKLHCDYVLNLPYDKYYFRISKKGISYRISCEKCSNRAEIKITVQNIPKFLIIHNENGCRENIKRFEAGFHLRNDSFPLIGVLESKDDFPQIDGKYQMNFQQYLTTIAISEKPAGSISDDYAIHYRHQNGWFTMSENGLPLSCPTDSITTTAGLSARFLIYGKLSSSQLIDDRFDVKEFFRNFELDKNIDLSSFSLNPEQWRGNIPPIECLNPIIRLERLDLSEFQHKAEMDCYIVGSTSNSISPSSDGDESDSSSVDSESVSSSRASIHSQSTVSEFSTESDQDWVDAYWSSVHRSDQSHIDLAKTNYPISSSGFSSATSSVVAWSAKNPKTRLNSSDYSDFLSDSSSVATYDSSSRKRKVDIDHMISIKRSRLY